MIKILLSGCCGKMGTVISNLVSEFPKLKIIAGIDKFPKELDYPVFSSPDDVNIEYDVLLDFSHVSTLHKLLDLTEKTKKPLVICSTGYSQEDLDLINEKSKSLPLFKSANMSLGINLINSLLRKITPLLYGNYDIEIIEKHHNQKLDSPSGTALLLADTIKDSIKEESLGPNNGNYIDFDLLISSMPKNIISEKAFNKRTRELINSLAFVYDLDTLKMSELIRMIINENGIIKIIHEKAKKANRKM